MTRFVRTNSNRQINDLRKSWSRDIRETATHGWSSLYALQPSDHAREVRIPLNEAPLNGTLMPHDRTQAIGPRNTTLDACAYRGFYQALAELDALLRLVPRVRRQCIHRLADLQRDIPMRDQLDT